MASSGVVEMYGFRTITEDQVVRLSESHSIYGNLPKTFFGGLVRPIGIEVETEGAVKEVVKYLGNFENARYWNAKEDGSLKDNGVELVSVPLSGNNIDYALHELTMLLNKCPRVRASVRTSVHVHCDVSDFEINEVAPLVALYGLFENLFFSQVSENRHNNPFCYEITDLLPYDVRVHPEMKYCAFNIAPIERQGSVEFRMGEFSTDMQKMRRWIQLVCKFMHFAGRNKARLAEIISDTIEKDTYTKLYKTVFGKSTVLFEGLNIFEMMKVNALWSATALENK